MDSQTTNLEILKDIFSHLTPDEQTEVLDFAEFLLLKRIEKEPMHPELRQELLERKREGLEELEAGETFSEKEVYEEIEVILGK